MALLTLGKNIMTIENAKGPILVNMLFWGGGKKKIPISSRGYNLKNVALNLRLCKRLIMIT